MVSQVCNVMFMVSYPRQGARFTLTIHKIHPLRRHYTWLGVTVGDGADDTTGAGVSVADITLSSNTLSWMLRVPVA